MRSSLFFSSLLLALASTGYGQLVAGYGYKLPTSITAAPGQVMMFSVNGVAARLTSPVFPVATNGLPTLVNGLTVEFAQGPVTVQMQIRGIQQTACPSTGTCSPATSFTIQMPYELVVESRDAALLRVRENAAIVAEVPILPVTDGIHVINTCDQTGIFLSIATQVPAGACAPVVTHGSKLVSATSPAIPGETLVIWAYGLGAINHDVPLRFTSVDELPLAVQPFNVSFSYYNPEPARSPLRRLGTALPSYTGMPGGGLYQIQVVVPPAPADLGTCRTTGQGNLRVVVSGPSSSDFAELCMVPGFPATN